MRSILPISLLAVAVFSLILVASADVSSGEICNDVKVYIQNEDDTYTMSTINNVQTVLSAVQAAAQDQGKDVKYNITKTNVQSVDGRKNDKDHMWRVFQWLPKGTAGWGVQTFSSTSNEKMVTGTTYCINYSTMESNDGTIVYSPPTFEPESEGYVFIRFANGFSPDNEHVNSVFTPKIRKDGFWIKGTGSDMGKVLFDAVDSNWPGEIELISGDMGGNTYSSWISSMFGIGDTNLGNNVWAYWSQWTWVDHQWVQNDSTLGYYDPAVYKYTEIIYLISTPDPYSDGFIIDKGGEEPNPDTDTIVCLKNKITVQFKLEDGSMWATQELKYGDRIDMTQIETPSIPSKGFVGWGDTNLQMYADAVFTASFVPITETMVRVTYTDSDGNFIRNEFLEPGSAATYAGIPTKNSTKQYDYTFKNWSSDLSSVTADITVFPVFEEVLREYNVSYYNYDRSFLAVKPTKYGTSAERPPDPERTSTVSYQFLFKGWSLTPNNYVSVDLDNITDEISVFAYFEPSAKDYTLTFKESDTVIATYTVKYGTPIGKTYPIDLFKGEYLVKMYRNSELTREYNTTHIIIGDTVVYVKKIVGSYDSARDESGNAVGDVLTLSFTSSLAGKITVSSGRAVVCDISQYPNGTTISIDRTSLNTIMQTLGSDTLVTIKVPRGSVTMKASDYLKILGNGEKITYSVGNGPKSVKISTALSKINYDSFYRLNLKSDNMSVMDLSAIGISAEVSLLLDFPDGIRSYVWNITSTGATTYIESSFSDKYVSFNTNLMQFYAVGTKDAVQVKQDVIVPYGTMEYHLDGSGMHGHASLIGMVLDNKGEIASVPSAVSGCTLRTIGPGALNGLINTNAVIIPGTVTSFSWNGWASSISDVYFTGNCPVFEGAVPSSVTVHYSPSYSGWDASGGTPDLDIRLYEGSYKKDAFGFTYYRIGDSIFVHRYVYGLYVAIPASIAMDGTDYPVEHIDDGAFIFTKDTSVMNSYGLKYTRYSLNTIELTSSVKSIRTRAFLNSSVQVITNTESLTHIWDEAFSGCSSLSNIKFAEGLVFIGSSAFEGCEGNTFTRVTLPDSVQALGERAFFGCTNLTNVALGKGIESIPKHCFEKCSKITELDIQDSTTIISDYAFCDCTGLQYVDLKNVESVGEKAFYSTSGESSMEFIVIGEKAKRFGKGAFGNNKSLKEIEVHCTSFSGFEQAFTNVNLDAITFYAADGVIDSWSGYNTVPLTEPEIKKDNTLLRSVEIGLVVFFIAIGGISYYRKVKI